MTWRESGGRRRKSARGGGQNETNAPVDTPQCLWHSDDLGDDEGGGAEGGDDLDKTACLTEVHRPPPPHPPYSSCTGFPAATWRTLGRRCLRASTPD